MKRVLLAEDEDHIAKLIAFKLGREGFEVVCTSNGAEFLGQVVQGKWALAILDLMMPIMDGTEALRRLRTNADYSDLPVLVLSAKGGAKEEAATLSLGANRFLRKPFDPVELAKVVKEMTV